jgi:hypothetical protein
MTVPKLQGTIGPGFTISLKDAHGKKVATLKSGKCTFVVRPETAHATLTPVAVAALAQLGARLERGGRGPEPESA